MNSLLPANLSDLEREIEGAMSRLGEINIPTATLWNPMECPIEVIPYLAFALSVDHWDSEWPESTKRQVVATSLEIHKEKGTRPAVEKALSAINIDSEIHEWFEQTPKGKPGTFVVEALITDAGIDAGTVRDLSRQVDIAKRHSAHYTMRLILSSLSQYFIGAAVGTSPTATVEPYTIRELNSEGAMMVTASTFTSFLATVEAL